MVLGLTAGLVIATAPTILQAPGSSLATGGTTARSDFHLELPSAPDHSKAGTVIATIPLGVSPYGVAYDSQNGFVYVSNSYSSNVSVLNGTESVGNVVTGGILNCVAFDARNGLIYVANEGSDQVDVINGTTLVATVSVGTYPWGVAYDSANGYVYVSNFGSNNVSIINGTSVVSTVSVGSMPFGVAFDTSNNLVYVANQFSGSLSLINGTHVSATVSIGGDPTWVALDSGNGHVYVSEPASYEVVVLDGTTFIGTITFAGFPEGMAYDSGNGYVYIASRPSNLTAVNGTAVVGTISVGYEPFGVVYDPEDEYVYVANSDATVSVVSTVPPPPPSFAVSLSESGLPAGTLWWVNLTVGESFNSSTAKMSFSEPNGSYSYTVATADKEFKAKGGSFTVDGKPVTKSVKFTLVEYSVRITESGLPSGTKWWVNLTDGESFSSTASSMRFSEPNGTYSFKATSANKTYKATTGKFFVDGAKVAKRIKFVPDAGFFTPERWLTASSARWR